MNELLQKLAGATQKYDLAKAESLSHSLPSEAEFNQCGPLTRCGRNYAEYRQYVRELRQAEKAARAAHLAAIDEFLAGAPSQAEAKIAMKYVGI